jgi:hypothetical protein
VLSIGVTPSLVINDSVVASGESPNCALNGGGVIISRIASGISVDEFESVDSVSVINDGTIGIPPLPELLPETPQPQSTILVSSKYVMLVPE